MPTYPSEDTGFYHLTNNGWVRKDQAPFPPARLETWSYQAEFPAEDAKERIYLTRVWKDEGAAGMREILHHRFGMPIVPQPDRNITLECEP